MSTKPSPSKLRSDQIMLELMQLDPVRNQAHALELVTELVDLNTIASHLNESAEPQLVNLTEAGDRYKCSARTIRRMIDRGDLTAYRVGPKLLRIDIREADRVFRGEAA